MGESIIMPLNMAPLQMNYEIMVPIGPTSVKLSVQIEAGTMLPYTFEKMGTSFTLRTDWAFYLMNKYKLESILKDGSIEIAPCQLNSTLLHPGTQLVVNLRFKA